jgi:hypothetical protein
MIRPFVITMAGRCGRLNACFAMTEAIVASSNLLGPELPSIFIGSASREIKSRKYSF